MLIIPNIGQSEQVGNVVEDVGHLALYSVPSLVESFPASVIGTSGDLFNPPAWAAACMGVSTWRIVADLSSAGGGSISVDVSLPVPTYPTDPIHAAMMIEPYDQYLVYSTGVGTPLYMAIILPGLKPSYDWTNNKWFPPLSVNINGDTSGPGSVFGFVKVDVGAGPSDAAGPITVSFCGAAIPTTMTGDNISLTGTLTITPTAWFPIRIPVV